MDDKKKIVIISIIMLVTIAGIFYSLFLGNSLRFSDEQDYYNIAHNLLQKGSYSLNGIEPTAYRAPGYPLVLFLFLKIKDAIYLLRIVNFIFFGFSIFLVYSLLKKFSSEISGLIAAAFCLCYPVLFFTAGTLYPQTIGSALLLTVIFLLFSNYNWKIISSLGGITYGYLILLIPSFLYLLPIFSLYPWILKYQNKVKRFIVFLFFSSLIVLLWTYRNHVVFDRFVLISANSGFNLLLGNSEHTTPNSGRNTDVSKYSSHASDLNEIDADIYYRDQALKWIMENKSEALKLYFLKVFNYFNYRNELATKSESSKIKNIIMLVTYYPTLLLLMMRIITIRIYKPTRFEYFLLLLFISNIFLSAVFFTRIRFRLPFDLIQIIIASNFIYLLIKYRLDKRQKITVNK